MKFFKIKQSGNIKLICYGFFLICLVLCVIIEYFKTKLGKSDDYLTVAILFPALIAFMTLVLYVVLHGYYQMFHNQEQSCQEKKKDNELFRKWMNKRYGIPVADIDVSEIRKQLEMEMLNNQSIPLNKLSLDEVLKKHFKDGSKIMRMTDYTIIEYNWTFAMRRSTLPAVIISTSDGFQSVDMGIFDDDNADVLDIILKYIKDSK